jgi:hypothetical protein
MTGNEHYLRDDEGFSMAKWKQRVDRFRGVDLSSYIADGTIIGHFILDEPQDRANWHGSQVSPAQIEEMARYSKEIWPTLPTVVRAFPEYLKGQSYRYLDAVRIQYLDQFGPLDAFMSTHVREAKALGLAMIGGLNVINGGSSRSGIPGRRTGKFGMSAAEIRSWGSTFMSEPYLCGFLLWEYDENYFSRPDIKEALEELSRKARDLPKKVCDV